MNHIIGAIFIFLMIGSFIFANDMEAVLIDDTTSRVEKSVLDASKKQAVYSYNIANFMTPDFQPILYDEDRAFFSSIVPEDRDNSKLMIEYYMSKLTENRSRHSALTKLFSTKLAITRQVATLGKR